MTVFEQGDRGFLPQRTSGIKVAGGVGGNRVTSLAHSLDKYLLGTYFVPGTLKGCPCKAFGKGERSCVSKRPLRFERGGFVSQTLLGSICIWEPVWSRIVPCPCPWACSPGLLKAGGDSHSGSVEGWGVPVSLESPRRRALCLWLSKLPPPPSPCPLTSIGTSEMEGDGAGHTKKISPCSGGAPFYWLKRRVPHNHLVAIHSWQLLLIARCQARSSQQLHTTDVAAPVNDEPHQRRLRLYVAHFPLSQRWSSNLKFFVLRSFA